MAARAARFVIPGGRSQPCRGPGRHHWTAKCHPAGRRHRAPPGSHDVDALVRGEPQAVPIDQHLDVIRRHRVASLLGRGRGVLARDEPGDGLVLQPFPDVPLGGFGSLRELRRTGGTTLVQGPVQAEALAQVDDVQVERRHLVLVQPLR